MACVLKPGLAGTFPGEAFLLPKPYVQMNPIICTTIACLQMAFGPSTVRHVGQYTVLQTRTHFHYCRSYRPATPVKASAS